MSRFVPRLAGLAVLALSAGAALAAQEAPAEAFGPSQAPADRAAAAAEELDADRDVAADVAGAIGRGEAMPPARVRFELHRGQRELAQGLPARAAETFRAVTSGAPGHPGAWYLLSRALSEAGRTAEAAEAARLAVERHEALPAPVQAQFDHVSFLENLGVTLEQTGDLAGAEGAFRRAVAADPRRPVLHARLGSVLLRRGSDEEAATELRAAVDENPQLGAAWRRLGQVLIRLERFDEASRALQRAATLDPADPDVAFQQAQLHRATGETEAFERALARFERLREERDAVFQRRERVDQVLRSAVDRMRDEGCAAARPLLEQLLGNPEVSGGGYQRVRVLADLARCQTEAGELDEAERLLRRAWAERPGAFLVSHELGTLLARRGRVADAIPFLLDAAEANPFDYAVHVNLGLAWARLGRFNEALGELRRAVVLQPELTETRQLLLDLEWALGHRAQVVALLELGGVTRPDQATDADPARSRGEWVP